jgi:hypothetical protein
LEAMLPDFRLYWAVAENTKPSRSTTVKIFFIGYRVTTSFLVCVMKDVFN